MTAWPLLVLAAGGAMAALSSGRWQVSIAAWLKPALLLGFSRTQDPPVALAGVFGALFLAAAVSNRGVMPLRGGIVEIAVLGLGAVALAAVLGTVLAILGGRRS